MYYIINVIHSFSLFYLPRLLGFFAICLIFYEKELNFIIFHNIQTSVCMDILYYKFRRKKLIRCGYLKIYISQLKSEISLATTKISLVRFCRSVFF